MPESFRYDAFIAYASPDAEYAQKFYALLSTVGYRVFLDSIELCPGDDWAKKISEAQENSLLTVVLISTHSDSAYFQRQEILKAIKLTRNDQHRVVPVYLMGRQLTGVVPEELSQVQGIFFEDGASLLRIAQQVEASLITSKRRAEWQHDIDTRTAIIVTGCHHIPEIYDRRSAYDLREAIVHRGKAHKHTFLRSVVMGDIWFLNHSGNADHPNVIAIGSPGINRLSGLIAEQGESVENGLGDRWRIVRHNNRWALYGNLAEDTHDAVIAFEERHIAAFIRRAWPDGS